MTEKVFAAHILDFLFSLDLPVSLPEDVEVMNPFLTAETREIAKQFYNSFYSDHHKRRMIIGINPGRFGGGITGIPFTDPIRLMDECHIENPWPRKQELSSIFIYDMIRAFGGVEKFYQHFYITAVSPLGFTKLGRNLNYYDDRLLMSSLSTYVKDWFRRQLDFGIHRDVAFCLGDGKNFKYLKSLNNETHYFKEIFPLSHPRFIMQYKLKKKEDYIDYYLEQFEKYTFKP